MSCGDEFIASSHRGQIGIHLWANNCFYTMKYDNGNERTLVRQPVKFQEAGIPEYNRGPMIGEQGPEILKEIGYTDEQVQAMLDSGALYVWKDERK